MTPRDDLNNFVITVRKAPNVFYITVPLSPVPRHFEPYSEYFATCFYYRKHHDYYSVRFTYDVSVTEARRVTEYIMRTYFNDDCQFVEAF